MSDFNVRLMAEELGKSLEDLAPKVEEELNQAIHNLAHTAYAEIIAQAQASSMEDAKRKEYLSSLEIQQIGDASYIIFLEGDSAKRTEEGVSSYDMRKTLLESKSTVSKGSRAGQNWVRTSKSGKKYASVPFEHKSDKVKPSGDLMSDIKKLTAKNRQGLQQSITKVFKDLEGNPLSGKVASVSNVGDEINSHLNGLTKYQSVAEDGSVSSVYMTYRTISENVTGGWIHPGHPGYKFFEKAEKYVEEELANIINTII